MKKLLSVCLSAVLSFVLFGCSQSEEQRLISAGNEFMDKVKESMQENEPPFDYGNAKIEDNTYTCQMGKNQQNIDVSLAIDENGNVYSFLISKYDITAENIVDTIDVMDIVYIPMMSQISFNEETWDKVRESIVSERDDNTLITDETSDASFIISYNSPLYSTYDGQTFTFKKPRSRITENDETYDVTGTELVANGAYSIMVSKK